MSPTSSTPQIRGGLRLTTVAALHDLNLAAMFCGDFAVISAGCIVADVLTAELIADVYDAECLVTTHLVTAPRSSPSSHAAAAELSIAMSCSY